MKKEKKKKSQKVRKKKKKEKKKERKKKMKIERIEELWSSKESTLICLLSYVIPSFLTIIEMV